MTPFLPYTSRRLRVSSQLVRLCVRRHTRATVAHFIRTAGTVVDGSVSDSSVAVTSVIVSLVAGSSVPRFPRASGIVLDT